jgi:hypothetical protein
MRVAGTLILALLTFGCGVDQRPFEFAPGEPLPPSEEGERVLLGSWLVDRVCAGTIAEIDAELTRAEDELGLGRHPEPVAIYVDDSEELAKHCQEGERSCRVEGASPGEIHLFTAAYEDALIPELVGDRLAYTFASEAHPFFAGGLAAAHARPQCPRQQGTTLPTPDDLLLGAMSDRLGLPSASLDDRRYYGGELLRWLLDTHGSAALLAFMADTNLAQGPDAIRERYLEHFGASFDAEVFAHLRGVDEPLTPERSGCLAPEAPRSPDINRIELEAELDCASPRVHNDFTNASWGYVEWRLTIETVGRYRLLEAPPEGTWLFIQACACETGPLTQQPTWPFWLLVDGTYFEADVPLDLNPGVYRLRWSGPLDRGAILDVAIEEPCDFGVQDCGPGEQCTPDGECVEAPTDPPKLGEACDYSEESKGWTCELGSLCIGDLLDDGVEEGLCMSYCDPGTAGFECSSELECSHVEVCAESCDALVQGCEAGWGCVPDFDTGVGSCLPVGEVGLFEECVGVLLECEPGLVCLPNSVIPSCWGDGWFSGCCTPLCDAGAVDPGCPAELPNCVAQAGTLGVCRE